VRISIIVPALNEAAQITATLVTLQPLRRAGHEVIVVDGGSRDATLTLAQPFADKVLTGPRGRASQMNAGAAVASGDVLLFLHADSQLPIDGAAAIVDELPRSRRRWGRFDIAIAGRPRSLRLVARSMNIRSRLTGVATGDQGMFVERGLFAAVRGFPEQPLMEDIALSRLLKRVAGRPLCLRQQVITSGRRWEANGVWRTIAMMWRLRYDYWRGVDPARLAHMYARLRRHRSHKPTPLPTLQIFAKAPIAGTVKTRLAPQVGTVCALEIHEQLVKRTLATALAARTAGIVGRIELWCTPSSDHSAFRVWRDRYRVTLATQQGSDLGHRMQHALGTSLARGVPAILIGSDCPPLDVSYLANAASALDNDDIVFGPAEDGGYVLVGAARAVDAFSDIAWGTESVMAQTRARLRAVPVSWHELPTLWDVDTPNDLARWNDHVARGLAKETTQAAVRT
jgi:rSAM/selenodomain-associated transferase 2/rSAM/selenodomain-associated transferase 1